MRIVLVKKLFVGACIALGCQAAFAQQPPIGVPPALEVQRLAPQLVSFFGPLANFQNLVNGLALGQPITLATVGADGVTRLVTFTPVGVPLTPLQIAQTLETARNQLITRGIATPTGEQVAVTLNGGTLQTALGGIPVTGLLQPPVAPDAAAASGASQPSPAALLQQQVLPNSAASTNVPGTATTSTSPFGRGISDSQLPTTLPGSTTTPAPVTAQPPAQIIVPPSRQAPPARFGTR